MELNAQIKKYRTELNLSQEALAEKVYVTRQTISNWENGKSYPDIHSLLLLSSLFNVSLDQLIKGDIETMKEIINEQEVKKFNYYGNIFSIHFLILIITAAPLFFWLERYAFIPFGVLFAITMFWALKVCAGGTSSSCCLTMSFRFLVRLICTSAAADFLSPYWFSPFW